MALSTRHLFSILLASLLAISAAGSGHAASSITRSVLGGGAIGAIGSTHRLRSTLGQPSVSTVSSSHHLLRAGFWWTGGVVAAAPQAGLPTVFKLATVAPNPFQRELAIEYDVPAAAGPLSLRVYDIGGRLVRTLAQGRAEPGRHRVLWDREDDAGHRSGVGLYVLLFEAPGLKSARKVLALP